MRYTVKAPLQPEAVFEDNGFTFKGKSYNYSDIESFSNISSATALTNGVIQITLSNSKILTLAFDKKHIDEATKVISFLNDFVNSKGRTQVPIEDTTAKGLYAYCKNNSYGSGFNEASGVQHFQLLINNLMDGETILFPFIGLHNYSSVSKHDGNFAYAVTNKRIIMGQKKVFGENFQSINWNNVNDITFTSGMAMGVITIDTIKEKFNVALDKISAQRVNRRIHEVFEQVKHPASGTEKSGNEVENPYEQLKKLKELLDMGVITQEDFDAKKKILLGL